MSDAALREPLIGRERELRALTELLDGIQKRGAAVIGRKWRVTRRIAQKEVTDPGAACAAAAKRLAVVASQ